MSIEAFVRKKGNNYTLMQSRAALLLAEHDLKAAAARLGLVCNDSHVYLQLFDLPCRVRLTDGYAECAEAGTFRAAEFGAAMILFDLLGYTTENARPADDYALLRSFSRVQNARSYAGEGMFADAERDFDRQFALLKPACEALGGVPFGKGDASYRIPLFKDLHMVFSFWRSDEDFPASLGLRFDANTLQYMHYETMWYAAFLCIHRISAHFQNP